MDQCGDNRFEIIEKAKQDLLNSTNIDSSKDEMKVLDSFLFRCWQMGWLKQYDNESKQTVSFINKCGSHFPTLVEKDKDKPLECDRDVVRMLYDRTDSVKVRKALESLFRSECLPDDNIIQPLFDNTIEDEEEFLPSHQARKVGTAYQRTRRNLATQICSAMIMADTEHTISIDALTDKAFEVADVLLTKSLMNDNGETSETTVD